MTHRWGVLVAVIAGVWLAGGALAAASEEAPSTPEQARASAEEMEKTFHQGLRYEETQDYRQAIETFKRVLASNRRQAKVLSHLAFCSRMVQDDRQVITYCRNVLRLQPDLIEERLWLGEAYLKTGQMPLAQTQYVKLLQRDSQKAEALKRLIEAQGGTVPSAEELAARAAAKQESVGGRSSTQ